MPWEVPIAIGDTEYPVTFHQEEEPTQQQIQEAVEHLKRNAEPSGVDSFGRSLLRGIAPARLGGGIGGRLGGLAGGALGGLIAGGAEGSVVPGIGTIIGSLLGAGIGMYYAGKGQEALADYVNPSAENPFSTASQQADYEANPILSELGGLSQFKPNLMKAGRAFTAGLSKEGRALVAEGFKLNNQLQAGENAANIINTPRAQKALQAFHDLSSVAGNVGIGGGMGALEGQDLQGILKSAGIGALFNDEWLHGASTHPQTFETRQVGPAGEPQVPRLGYTPEVKETPIVTPQDQARAESAERAKPLTTEEEQRLNALVNLKENWPMPLSNEQQAELDRLNAKAGAQAAAMENQSPQARLGLQGQLRQEEVLSPEGDPRMLARKSGSGEVAAPTPDQIDNLPDSVAHDITAKSEKARFDANAELFRRTEELRRRDERLAAAARKSAEVIAQPVDPVVDESTSETKRAAAEALVTQTEIAEDESQLQSDQEQLRNREQQDRADLQARQEAASQAFRAAEVERRKQEEFIRKAEEAKAKQAAAKPAAAPEPAPAPRPSRPKKGGAPKEEAPPTTDKIVAATFTPDAASPENFFVGENHIDAAGSAGVEAPTQRKQRETPEYGFLVESEDGTRKVVSRQEAYAIARSNGQLKKGKKVIGQQLHSDHIDMPTVDLVKKMRAKKAGEKPQPPAAPAPEPAPEPPKPSTPPAPSEPEPLPPVAPKTEAKDTAPLDQETRTSKEIRDSGIGLRPGSKEFNDAASAVKKVGQDGKLIKAWYGGWDGEGGSEDRVIDLDINGKKIRAWFTGSKDIGNFLTSAIDLGASDKPVAEPPKAAPEPPKPSKPRQQGPKLADKIAEGLDPKKKADFKSLREKLRNGPKPKAPSSTEPIQDKPLISGNLPDEVVDYSKALYGMSADKDVWKKEMLSKFGDSVLGRLDKIWGELQAAKPSDMKAGGVESIELGMNKKQLMTLLGRKMYDKPIAEVTTKELLQNALDASRGAGSTKDNPKVIDINYDRKKRTLSVKDSGNGMDTQTVKDAFFTLGGTKKTTRPEDTSGGLGLAKMAFMLGSKKIHLETTKDGITTSTTATAEQIADGFFDLKTEKTGKPSGTRVEVEFPETYTDSEGEKKDLYLPYKPNFLSEPLIADVEVRYNGDVLPIGVHQEKLQKDNTFHFSWGDIHMYVDPARNEYPSIGVMSAGLNQFKLGAGDVFGYSQDSPKFPHDIILDVRPKVRTDSEAYPFNNQREGWRPTVNADIAMLYKFLQQNAVFKQLTDAKESFKNIKQLPRTSKTNLDDADVETLFKKYGSREDKRAAASSQPKATSVDFSNKDSKTVTITFEDGTKKKIDKEVYVKPSFEASKKLDPKDLGIDTSTFDNKVAQFHNNTSEDYSEAMPAIIEFGNVMYDFVRKFGEQVKNAEGDYSPYAALTSTDPDGWFTGISIDKSYRGLNTIKPFKAIWANPISLSSFGKVSPAAAASELLHIFIHEITHVNARNEGAGFTSELANNYGRIRAHNIPVEVYENNLAKIFDKHWERILNASEKYDDYNTKNSAGSFESSAERLGREAEAGGTDLPSGVHAQGDEQVQEQGRAVPEGLEGIPGQSGSLGEIISGAKSRTVLLDPEYLSYATKYAKYAIDSGIDRFADYAKAVIEDVGEQIKPYLSYGWNSAKAGGTESEAEAMAVRENIIDYISDAAKDKRTTHESLYKFIKGIVGNDKAMIKDLADAILPREKKNPTIEDISRELIKTEAAKRKLAEKASKTEKRRVVLKENEEGVTVGEDVDLPKEEEPGYDDEEEVVPKKKSAYETQKTEEGELTEADLTDDEIVSRFDGGETSEEDLDEIEDLGKSIKSLMEGEGSTKQELESGDEVTIERDGESINATVLRVNDDGTVTVEWSKKEIDDDGKRVVKGFRTTLPKDQVKGGAEGGFARIPSPILDFADKIHNMTKDFVTWGKSMVKRFGNGVKSVLRDLWTYLKNASQRGSIGSRADELMGEPLGQEHNNYLKRIPIDIENAQLYLNRQSPKTQDAIEIGKEMEERASRSDAIPGHIDEIKNTDFSNLEEVNKLMSRLDRLTKDYFDSRENAFRKKIEDSRRPIGRYERGSIGSKSTEAFGKKKERGTPPEPTEKNPFSYRLHGQITTEPDGTKGKGKEFLDKAKGVVREIGKLEHSESIEPAIALHRKMQEAEGKATVFEKKADAVFKSPLENKAASLYTDSLLRAKKAKITPEVQLANDYKEMLDKDKRLAAAWKPAYDMAIRGLSEQQKTFARDAGKAELYEYGKKLQDAGHLKKIENEQGRIVGSVLDNQSLGYYPRFVSKKEIAKRGSLQSRSYDSLKDLILGGHNLETWNYGKNIGRYMRRAQEILARPELIGDALEQTDENHVPKAIVIRSHPMNVKGAQAPKPVAHISESRLQEDGERWDEERHMWKQVDHYSTRNIPIAVEMPDGTVDYRMAEVAFSPRLAKIYRNEVGRSKIAEWYETPSSSTSEHVLKKIAQVLDEKVNQIAKGAMFLGSPFHAVTVGVRALAHGVLPFGKINEATLDPEKNPKLMDAISHGAQLYSEKSERSYGEGAGFIGINKDHPASKAMNMIGDWMFSRYIPWLQLKTYEHIEPSVMKRFGYQPDGVDANGIAKYKPIKGEPDVSVSQIKFDLWKSINDEFGHLNYRLIGADKTLRHLTSLALLAPQFTAGTLKTIGSAAKGLVGFKSGRENARALLMTTALGYAATRVINMLINDGDPKTDKPFSVVWNGRAYSLRTIPGDIVHMFNDPSGFFANKMSPLARFGQEEILQRNQRGEKVSHLQGLKDLGAGFIPMSIRGVPGVSSLTESTRTTPVSTLDSALQFLGVNSSDNSPIRTTYARAAKWKEANGEENTGAYPISRYTPLKRALENGDHEEANAHWHELIDEEKKKNPTKSIGEIKGRLIAGIKQGLDHPFTGSDEKEKKFFKSLDDTGKAEYKEATRKLKSMWHLIRSISGVGTGELKLIQ